MGFLDFFFGKRKKDEQGAPAQFLRPVRLRETEGGRLAFERAKRRLAGIGLGIDPKFIEGATAPFAQQLRSAFERKTAPRISAAASARGLGRSTIPVAQIGQRRAGVEETIATEAGRRRLANELLKLKQEQEAATTLERFGIQETGAADRQSQLNRLEFARQEAIREGNRERADNITKQIAALGIRAGGAAIGGAVGGPAGVAAGMGVANAIIGSGQGGAPEADELDLLRSAISRILSTQTATTS